MTLTTIRQWHTYIGLFTAPSVLFFALTGAAQLFNLHEAHGSYRPPALVEKLSSVHKDQVFAFGDHHAKDSDAGAAAAAQGAPPSGDAEDGSDKTDVSALILKGFFLLVALSLVVSTVFGLWMGLTQTRRNTGAWWLIIAGALIPVGLILF
jgi:hypothetical protein